jgi:hypothetical protein
VNVLDKNKNTINKYTTYPLDASKDVGVEVNGEKAKYILFSPRHNAG